MKKIASMLLLGVAAFSTAGIASAMPNTARVPATNTYSGGDVLIPAHAVEVAENVFSLGSSIDPKTGKKVDGYAIFHPKSPSQKPSGTPGGNKGATSCFGFLSKGAKWKTVEPWVVDPVNAEGLSEAAVFSLLDTSIGKWEDAADGVVTGTSSMNIIGAGAVSSGFGAAGVLDGVNGVRFGELEQGTIGVTTVWGIFSGPVSGRELVEWDQVYNTYYSWNTDGSSDDMDFESITTHELGHTFGLADLYQSECSAETMYGYGSEGEIKARDLNAGDIAGISTLY